jgi:hypothetical protein
MVAGFGPLGYPWNYLQAVEKWKSVG